MSTTITYKGDTIATLSNNTKTLKTSGKYLEDDITVTESIPSGSATTPATTITANPSISVSSGGLITATASATQSVTPTVSEGYISSGTAGTVTVSGSNTEQLSTQAGTTIAPTESEQTAVASGKYTTGVVKVGAISSTYVGSGISQNDSDDLTVSDATVTAPAGYYASAASKSVAISTLPTEVELGYRGELKATIERSTSTRYLNISAGYVTSDVAYKINSVPNMTLPTAVASSATSGYISKATVSVSESDQYLNIPTGYNSAGAYYKIEKVPSTYVGSGITRRTAEDLVVYGAQISAPAGYYENIASKSVQSMSLPTSTSDSAYSGYTSKATISRSTADQYLNIAYGYNAGNAYYKIEGVPNMTLPTTTDSTGASGYGQKAIISRSTSDQYINIPTGYNTAGAWYKINGVPNMTLPTSAASSATSGFTSKATISRSTSDQYINIPIGYNTAGAYYKVSAVPNGTAGTPTATKGTVSNNSITVTPSVTNTTGYITGSTKTGTAVTVSASELVSGTKSIAAAGTTDVTNYASVSVPAGSATTPRTEVDPDMHISVSSTGLITALTQETVSVTPSIEAGYVSEGTSGLILVNGKKTKQLDTQDKMVAMPDNTGDILAGKTLQYAYTFRADELVQGQWNLNVPSNTPLTRARTKDFIYVTAGDSITYTNNSYDCYFQVYGSTSSSTIAQNIGWKTDSGGTINITVNGYLTFVTRNHYNTSANVNPALWDGVVTLTHNRVHNGVYFTWNGTDTCVVSGTCNDVGAVSPMTEKQPLPSSIISGNTYYVTCTSTPLQSNVRLRIMFYDSNDTITDYLYFNQNGFFVVPSNAVSWNVQLHSMPSVSYSPTVTLSNIHIYPAKKIIDAGTYTTGDIYVSGY